MIISLKPFLKSVSPLVLSYFSWNEKGMLRHSTGTFLSMLQFRAEYTLLENRYTSTLHSYKCCGIQLEHFSACSRSEQRYTLLVKRQTGAEHSQKCCGIQLEHFSACSSSEQRYTRTLLENRYTSTLHSQKCCGIQLEHFSACSNSEQRYTLLVKRQTFIHYTLRNVAALGWTLLSLLQLRVEVHSQKILVQYTLLEMLQHSTGTILSMTRHEHLYEINKYTKNLVTLSLEKSNILYTCETTVAVIIKVH